MEKYSYLECFNGDYAQVAITINGHYKWGLIDRLGIEIIPTIYDNLTYIGGDRVFVNMGYKEGRKYQYSGKWGIVNLKNEVVMPFRYSNLSPWENFAVVCYRNKWGVIDYDGNTIIKLKYDLVFPTNNKEVYVFKKGDKYGLMDNREEVVVAPIYDEIKSWNSLDSEGWFVVRRDECWSYIDKNGQAVVISESSHNRI